MHYSEGFSLVSISVVVIALSLKCTDGMTSARIEQLSSARDRLSTLEALTQIAKNAITTAHVPKTCFCITSRQSVRVTSICVYVFAPYRLVLSFNGHCLFIVINFELFKSAYKILSAIEDMPLRVVQ